MYEWMKARGSENFGDAQWPYVPNFEDEFSPITLGQTARRKNRERMRGGGHNNIGRARLCSNISTDRIEIFREIPNVAEAFNAVFAIGTRRNSDIANATDREIGFGYLIFFKKMMESRDEDGHGMALLLPISPQLVRAIIGSDIGSASIVVNIPDVQFDDSANLRIEQVPGSGCLQRCSHRG
ncbi:hypothetical protein BFN67_23185 [Pseudaminobacter manganicus]|uniref:Uncharacterized protein n=1 Tax=Manganibacter manganicus TaxID=1873176 RepID=A0A1V8RLK7_9HYPH|nr:hypothetical protein BFN67_23185 [Pseudaminobacter manganicus]